MKLEYFDVHSHLYFPDFDHDREKEIHKMQKMGIGTITIGTNLETSKKSLELSEKHKNIFACVGQHPGELNKDSIFDEKLRKLAQNGRVVCIGECGLDYFRIDPTDFELKMIQKTIFEYHVDLSLDLDKPLMLHIRSSKGTTDAYNDSLNILEHHSKTSDNLKGNAHFFAGDMDVLKRLLGIGFSVSFTGVITFTKDYDDFIKYTPLDMILVETDAPFVAPVPHRGKRNSPVYIEEVIRRIAEIKNEDFEVVKKSLFDNTLRHFKGINDALASLPIL